MNAVIARLGEEGEEAGAPAPAAAVRRETYTTPEPDEFDLATVSLSPTELRMLDAAAGAPKQRGPSAPRGAPRTAVAARRPAIAPMPMGHFARGV